MPNVITLADAKDRFRGIPPGDAVADLRQLAHVARTLSSRHEAGLEIHPVMWALLDVTAERAEQTLGLTTRA